MDNSLIVSCTDKGTAYFTGLLNEAGINQISALPSCTEARRILLERDFDVIVVNAPLRDESGEQFARDAAAKGLCQVILVVKAELFDAVSSACEDDGIITIAKPINKGIFRAAIKMAGSTHCKLKTVFAENEKLKQKIEDIRIVDRAKCVLISYMNMDEKEAHRFIEKQAMDMRSTRRIVAERILKTYEQ